MSTNKYIPRTKLRLSKVESLIRQHRIIEPCPSRQTLINLCVDGTFESVGKDSNGFPSKTNFGWAIFEDSFWKWAKMLDGVLEN